MLTLIRQQHNNGCVPACLATLTGLPYKKALKIVYPWKKTKRWDYYGTDYQDILRALGRVGLKYKERDPVPFTKLHTNAIVIVEHPASGPPGERSHAVVWDYQQQRILDPNVGNWGMKRHLPQASYQKSVTSIIEVR
jgi:hypothetical protein